MLKAKNKRRKETAHTHTHTPTKKAFDFFFFFKLNSCTQTIFFVRFSYKNAFCYRMNWKKSHALRPLGLVCISGNARDIIQRIPSSGRCHRDKHRYFSSTFCVFIESSIHSKEKDRERERDENENDLYLLSVFVRIG